MNWSSPHPVCCLFMVVVLCVCMLLTGLFPSKTEARRKREEAEKERQAAFAALEEKARKQKEDDAAHAKAVRSSLCLMLSLSRCLEPSDTRLSLCYGSCTQSFHSCRSTRLVARA